MNAVEFLRVVLPSSGLICIGRGPFPKRDGTGQYFKHDGFETPADAASFATRHSLTDNVFFATHTLNEWSTDKYGRQVVRRNNANAKLCKTIFGDLDCGFRKDGTQKDYLNQEEAALALKKFCKATGLPRPMVINSGTGLHVYWVLKRAIASAEWRLIALKFKALAEFHGFKIDNISTDMARLLRVVGTFNRKDPSNPIKVAVIGPDAVEYDNELILAILEAASAGLQGPEGKARTNLPPAARARAPETLENVEAVRAMLANINPDIKYHQWLRAIWGIAALGWDCGEAIAREWSERGAKWDESAFATVWGDFDQSRGTGVGTLLHIAVEHGYSGPGLTSSVGGFFDGTDTNGPGVLDLGERPAGAVADVANGKRFAAAAGGRFLYIHDTREWLKFDPASGWTAAQMVEVEAFAKGVVEAMFHEAAEQWRQDRDGSEAKRLRLNVERVSRLPHMRAMIEMAMSEPGMSASLIEFDADPMLLGVQNGVLDLRTGTVRRVSPALRVSKRCRVQFDAAADCPRFMAFLERILPDADVRAFLCRWVGYTLTGSVKEQVFAFVHGSGANGKSVFVELLAWLLGDYSRKISTDMLMQQQRSSQGPDPDIVDLKGVRFAYANETEDGRRLSDARVKDMTGGDTLTGRVPYAKAAVRFEPTFKLVIAGNHKPTISDHSHGMWRRVILIPFDQTIPEGERDPDLLSKLKAEAPGILNWALAGLRDWMTGGLRVPLSIKAATAAYRDDQDIMKEFISECCEAGATLKVAKNSLRDKYQAWCLENGHKPMSSTRLTQDLGDRGFKRDAGRRNIIGLKLKPWTPP